MVKKIVLCMALFICAALFAEPVKFEAVMLPAGEIQPVGVTAKFTGKIMKGDGVPENAKVFYEEFVDGIRKRTGYVKFGEEVSLERKLDRPGWYDVRMRIVVENNRDVRVPGIRPHAMGRGFVVAPEKIARSGVRPADFDEFWAAQRAELDKVPVKELERKKIDWKGAFADKIDAFDVKVACAGNGPLSGILTMPKNAKPKSLPAIVFYMGAGVHTSGVQAAYGRMAIVFHMNAHSIENLQPREYYTKLKENELKNYWVAIRNDREKIYFKNMFIRVMRSLDYVKSLPEWNGQVLIVNGGSQGGAQSIVAAALDPQVTMMVAEVPAMCDHAGFLMKRPRLHGWPFFYTNAADKAVVEATAYYDMVNFASRIKCESVVTAGALDHTCSPCGVVSVYNAIPAAKKSLLVHPAGEHIIPQIDSKFRSVFQNRFLELFKESQR